MSIKISDKKSKKNTTNALKILLTNHIIQPQHLRKQTANKMKKIPNLENILNENTLTRNISNREDFYGKGNIKISGIK